MTKLYPLLFGADGEHSYFEVVNVKITSSSHMHIYMLGEDNHLDQSLRERIESLQFITSNHLDIKTALGGSLQVKENSNLSCLQIPIETDCHICITVTRRSNILSS